MAVKNAVTVNSALDYRNNRTNGPGLELGLVVH